MEGGLGCEESNDNGKEGIIQEDGNYLIMEKTFEKEQAPETSDKKGVRIEDTGDREGRLVHWYCKAGGAFDD